MTVNLLHMHAETRFVSSKQLRLFFFFSTVEITECCRDSSTCGVPPWDGTDRILEVWNHLVTQVKVVVPGLIHQVTAVQVPLDHLFFCHGSRQKLYGQQREPHLDRAVAPTTESRNETTCRVDTDFQGELSRLLERQVLRWLVLSFQFKI